MLLGCEGLFPLLSKILSIGTFYVDGEGNGGGEGSGNGDGGEKLGELESQLKELQGTVKSLQEAKSALESKLGEYESELLSEDYLNWKEGKTGGKADVEDEEGEVDLETASAKEIVRYLERKYRGDLEGAIESISGKIGEVEERVGLALARVDIELTALKHQDFWSYKDRIKKIAEENPTWSAEKCYKQAKLEMKMEEEEKLRKEEEKAEKERRALAEKGGVPPSIIQGKQLSKDEAAKLAYRAAFGNAKIEE